MLNAYVQVFPRGYYPLVNSHIAMGNHLMGKSTISMAIFNSFLMFFVCFPEGNRYSKYFQSHHCECIQRFPAFLPLSLGSPSPGLELLKDQNPGTREDATGGERSVVLIWCLPRV